MNILCKPSDSFPNWPLAVEFLKRAEFHFIIAVTAPPEDIDPNLRARILSPTDHALAPYMTVPGSWDQKRIIQLCEIIYRFQSSDPQGVATFSGSAGNSNMIGFLNFFSQTLQRKFELSEVAQAVTSRTCELFEAEGASILVPNAQRSAFQFAYIHNTSQAVSSRLLELEVPTDEGIVGWVTRHRKSVVVNNADENGNLYRNVDDQSHFHTRNILAAPIILGDELLAILEVVNKKRGDFSETDSHIIELIAAIIAIFIEKAQLYNERLGFARIEKELEIAHTLQNRLMPLPRLEVGPFRILGEVRQVSQVGGDFWDVIDVDSNHNLLVLGDVSGHGLSAALVMSAVRTACRALLPHLSSPRDLLVTLNQLVNLEFASENLYVTAILMELDLQHGTIRFARAGHEYPLLHRDAGITVLDQVGVLPLGLFQENYPAPWNEVRLAKGEWLYLYTDGVPDGLSQSREEFHHSLAGLPGIEGFLAETKFFDQLIERFNWRSDDDATFLAISLA